MKLTGPGFANHHYQWVKLARPVLNVIEPHWSSKYVENREENGRDGSSFGHESHDPRRREAIRTSDTLLPLSHCYHLYKFALYKPQMEYDLSPHLVPSCGLGTVYYIPNFVTEEEEAYLMKKVPFTAYLMWDMTKRMARYWMLLKQHGRT